jgi:hypothetical protein
MKLHWRRTLVQYIFIEQINSKPPEILGAFLLCITTFIQ